MWQCPYHEDDHVLPGNDCESCILKEEIEENAARERKEQEEK